MLRCRDRLCQHPQVNLSHDELSQSFFLMNPLGLTRLTRALKHLAILRLDFHVKEDNAAPFVKVWRGPNHFLKSIPMLKVLRFNFDKEMSCQEPQWITGYQRPSRRDASMYYVPLWKMFDKRTLSELDALRLGDLLMFFADLVSWFLELRAACPLL